MRRVSTKRALGASLFAEHGPRPDDVRMLPGRNDCYLLAAAQAVAARNPQHLRAAIRQLPDGVLVQPSDNAAPVVLRGDLSRWQGTATALTWPAAVEAAYACARGGAAVLRKPGDPSDALTWLTGAPAATFVAQVGGGALPAQLASLWSHGECVVLHTHSHAFALVGIEVGESATALQLMDPARRWWRRSRVRTFVYRAETRWPRVVAYSTTTGNSCTDVRP